MVVSLVITYTRTPKIVYNSLIIVVVKGDTSHWNSFVVHHFGIRWVRAGTHSAYKVHIIRCNGINSRPEASKVDHPVHLQMCVFSSGHISCFIHLWPWRWPCDLHIWTWRRYSEYVFVYQNEFSIYRCLSLVFCYFQQVSSCFHICCPVSIWVSLRLNLSSVHDHSISCSNYSR